MCFNNQVNNGHIILSKILARRPKYASYLIDVEEIVEPRLRTQGPVNTKNLISPASECGRIGRICAIIMAAQGERKVATTINADGMIDISF